MKTLMFMLGGKMTKVNSYRLQHKMSITPSKWNYLKTMKSFLAQETILLWEISKLIKYSSTGSLKGSFNLNLWVKIKSGGLESLKIKALSISVLKERQGSLKQWAKCQFIIKKRSQEQLKTSLTKSNGTSIWRNKSLEWDTWINSQDCWRWVLMSIWSAK